jgi:hypothetical protein
MPVARGDRLHAAGWGAMLISPFLCLLGGIGTKLAGIEDASGVLPMIVIFIGALVGFLMPRMIFALLDEERWERRSRRRAGASSNNLSPHLDPESGSDDDSGGQWLDVAGEQSMG